MCDKISPLNSLAGSKQHAPIHVLFIELNTMKLPTYFSLFILIISLAISASALAEYVWLDKDDHKQFSDHPPPVSVPEDKILKSAGKGRDDQSSATNSTEKIRQSENLANKDFAYKKRRDELTAKEKKEEEKAKTNATKNENCRRLKKYKQGLKSGQRVTQMYANGSLPLHDR